ncbi:MAG: Hsp70 family protein [Marinilabiliaceae bacterium]|nr:Hsp70 family protein [Marinilabiliaceae bacterium]
MSKSNFIFGIDVGTSTTAASYYNTNQKILASQSLHGQTIFPSIVKDNGKEVINFKIHFWHTDNPSKETISYMANWLLWLRDGLKDVYKDGFNEHIYCFTYPAQRQAILSKYQNIIKDVGFPISKNSVRALVVEEPIAAALSYLKESQNKPGLGIVLDIGAGTTDISIIEIQGENQIHIHDASSMDIAGNVCTQKMKDLIVDKGLHNDFEKLIKTNQRAIDGIKEMFSDYYSEEENREEAFSFKSNGIKFKSTFDQFTESMVPIWGDINKLISERLKIKGIDVSDLDFIYGVGGGVMHNGLWNLVEKTYGEKAFRSNEARYAVARGAALHAAAATSSYRESKGSKEEQKIEVSYQIGKDVKVAFPDDTEQHPVTIFNKESLFKLGQRVDGSFPICLQSNILFPEGDAIIEIEGFEPITIGEIDINWYGGDENDNHGGDIKWSFFPDEGRLTVSAKLDRTKINTEGYTIIGEVTISVTPSGSYKCTLPDMN